MCAEQLSSPSCAGVAAGEVTLGMLGVGVCSQAFANASWTVVPWWKVRMDAVPPLRVRKLTRPRQVVGITVMLTLMGVLFALAAVARWRLVSLEDSSSSFLSLDTQGSGRLQVNVGGPHKPIFPSRTPPGM